MAAKSKPPVKTNPAKSDPMPFAGDAMPTAPSKFVPGKKGQVPPQFLKKKKG